MGLDVEFTPRVSEDSEERLHIKMSGEEWQASGLDQRGLGYHGTVTDPETGKRYNVFGRACSLPHCVCDAYVEEVKGWKKNI